MNKNQEKCTCDEGSEVSETVGHYLGCPLFKREADGSLPKDKYIALPKQEDWEKEFMDKFAEDPEHQDWWLTDYLRDNQTPREHDVTPKEVIGFIRAEIDSAFLAGQRSMIEQVKEFLALEVDEDYEGTDEEIELMKKIYGTSKVPEYMKERRHGMNVFRKIVLSSLQTLEDNLK